MTRLARIALVLSFASAAHALADWSLDADKEERIAALFEEWDRPDSPGAVVGIVRRGELLYSRGFGSANLDHQVPLGPDSVVYIASTSKQFAAAGIAVLSLEGVLSLEDDVRRWIPELPPYHPPVTIRHLVHHTSGLRDYLSLMALRGSSFEEPFENADAIELLARQKGVNFAPSEQHLYSNSNYVLLAEIVQRASGMSSQEFARSRFFEPLGMKSTRWGLEPRRVMPGRVTGYERDEKTGDFRGLLPNFSGHGDGNLWTTVRDLALWDGNFYQPRGGGPGFLDLVLTRGRLGDGKVLDYAFGLVHGTYKTHPTLSHGGSFLGYRAQLIRFPEEGLAVIVLANLASIDPTKLAERIADVVLELPDAADPVESATFLHVPDEQLAAYVGEYFDAARGRLLEVALDGKRLLLKGMGEPIPLHQRSLRTFGNRGRALEVTFETEETGAATTLALDVTTSRAPVRAARIERAKAGARELAGLQGRYWSAELDCFWVIEPSDGKLLVRGPGRFEKEPPELGPLDRDRFDGPFFDVAFERDAGGGISGFRVLSDRASGMVFERTTR